uniref:3-methyl-2-oxobutanoate hydroxymethyltransferase n=1 Tax=Acetobacter thailandicus TaxID=1502842 RepID=UPI0015684C72
MSAPGASSDKRKRSRFLSKHKAGKRHTLRSLARLEAPIVALTAYTTPMARLMDPHCDLLLVGDSLGMVVYGMPSTLGVTTEMMIAHGQAVIRGSSRACVAVDLPFGSYQKSPQQAFETAARVMAQTEAGCVKLEGGEEMAETIYFLTQRGVPVIGHIGLKPQAVHTHGGFRTVGRGSEADQIIKDADAVVAAGAGAVVIESTVEPLARALSDRLPVPTIGIGASPACGGQILVGEDMLGLFTDFTPRFVRQFGTLAADIDKAVAAYAEAVRTRQFPGPENYVSASGTKTEGA